MKKITLLLLLSLSLFACSSDSGNDPIPATTEKLLMVSDTNIPVMQGELHIFVNNVAQGNQTMSRTVKVGDVVRIQSGSFPPPSATYYVTVKIEGKLIVDHFTNGADMPMNWVHTVTTEDFQP